MQSVHHALDILKEKLDLPELSTNADGQAEIRFSDRMVTHITCLDDKVLELSFRLPELDHADGPMMAAMLAANCLGASTGSGRLAIDAQKGEVIYCERWDVLDMGADSVERRFAAFAETGTFWLTAGSQMINEVAAASARSTGRASATAPSDAEPAYLLRL